MRFNHMNQLVIGDTVVPLPIVQGGMGIGVSMSHLAAAVANEGGIGVISAAGVGLFYPKSEDRDFEENNVYGLQQEIRKARHMTNGLLGVNIMVALTNYANLVRIAIDEGIDFIFAGAGLPLDLPKYLKPGSKTKLVPIISSGRAASILAKKWPSNYGYLPDAFVVEGPRAGGHLGFKKGTLADEENKLERLLPGVLEAIKPYEEAYGRKIPVIVGGGIYSGADIHYFLHHGAAAVQMATRFVTTDECDASDAFKQTYLDAKETDIVYIDSPVGLPGRAIRNQFLNDVEAGLKHPFSCPYDCIITCKKEEAPYCITLALLNAKKGKLNNGFAFAGTNAFRATKIISVKELIQILKEEFSNASLAFGI